MFQVLIFWKLSNGAEDAMTVSPMASSANNADVQTGANSQTNKSSTLLEMNLAKVFIMYINLIFKVLEKELYMIFSSSLLNRLLSEINIASTYCRFLKYHMSKH